MSRDICLQSISSIMPWNTLLMNPESVSSSISAFRHSSFVPPSFKSAALDHSSIKFRANRDVDQVIRKSTLPAAQNALAF
ncbi:MAG: hypothetical protein V4451_04865 [Pseudomonadota bacterium]